MTSRTKLGLIAVLSLLAELVFAVPLALDFRGADFHGIGSGNLRANKAMGSDSVSGIDFVIRGYDYQLANDGDMGSADHIHRNSRRGLGVIAARAGKHVGRDEGLALDFGSAIANNFSVLIFETGKASKGALELWVDGNFSRRISWQTGRGGFARHRIDNVSGSHLEFRGLNKGFRLAGFNAEVTEVFAVPSPTSLPLIGLAFAAFFRVRAKNQSTGRQVHG
ncbi:MAG: hypothetical protein AAF384_09730 [Pseudomonadota bacterium]